jgi:hypothetical protein
MMRTMRMTRTMMRAREEARGRASDDEDAG